MHPTKNRRWHGLLAALYSFLQNKTTLFPPPEQSGNPMALAGRDDSHERLVLPTKRTPPVARTEKGDALMGTRRECDGYPDVLALAFSLSQEISKYHENDSLYDDDDDELPLYDDSDFLSTAYLLDLY
jgi:hypothetical protein